MIAAGPLDKFIWPLPTGFVPKSAPYFWSAAGLAMPPAGWEIVAIMAAKGCLATSLTVPSSMTSTWSRTGAKYPFRFSVVVESTRSKLALTAWALKGVPSWNFTPGTNLKVNSFASAEGSHDCASTFMTLMV